VLALVTPEACTERKPRGAYLLEPSVALLHKSHASLTFSSTLGQVTEWFCSVLQAKTAAESRNRCLPTSPSKSFTWQIRSVRLICRTTNYTSQVVPPDFRGRCSFHSNAWFTVTIAWPTSCDRSIGRYSHRPLTTFPNQTAHGVACNLAPAFEFLTLSWLSSVRSALKRVIAYDALFRPLTTWIHLPVTSAVRSFFLSTTPPRQTESNVQHTPTKSWSNPF
jgi:hypothetical protein